MEAKEIMRTASELLCVAFRFMKLLLEESLDCVYMIVVVKRIIKIILCIIEKSLEIGTPIFDEFRTGIQFYQNKTKGHENQLYRKKQTVSFSAINYLHSAIFFITKCN